MVVPDAPRRAAPSTQRRAALLTLGCARNEVDSEELAGRLSGSGWELVDLDADTALVAPQVSALRVFAGHAGWDGGQLEDEVAQGAWYVVPSQPADLFSPEPESLWRTVLRRQPAPLWWVATYPDDPSDN